MYYLFIVWAQHLVVQINYLSTENHFVNLTMIFHAKNPPINI